MWPKNTVHERDRHRCVNCRRSVDIVECLDIDHCVPRGVGGAEQIPQLVSLCRRCHDAKHGSGVAPTVRAQSTGTMTDYEFVLYNRFGKKMVPALARQVDVPLEPKFNIADENEWAMPLGDLRRLSEQLEEHDEHYTVLKAHEVM